MLLKNLFNILLVFLCLTQTIEAASPDNTIIQTNRDDSVVSWGIITDVHYADIDSGSSRVYRDSIPKVQQACKDFTESNVDFMIELGDFKDTGCKGDFAPTPECISDTIGYLETIEATAAEIYKGPRFHVYGNHDVDILSQTNVSQALNDTGFPLETGGLGYYAWSFPPAPATTQPLRFIVLNGDYTAQDEPWNDLEHPNNPNMTWDNPNLPSNQMIWLKAQLDTAETANQHVVIFVHYRLDGMDGGPVGTGLGPPLDPKHRNYINDCSLDNSKDVRDLLEAKPGLVLATFSGHDHTPMPPWTKETVDTPLYFTHAALVEGAWPSNAYSKVSILSNCSIVVDGIGNLTTSVVVDGPQNCKL